MKKFLTAVLLVVPGLAYPSSDIGLFGGYSSVWGEYRKELSSAGRFGIYYLPFVSEYLQVECNASYSGYSLRDNRSSLLYCAGVGVIPQAKLNLIHSISLFAGPGLAGEYLYLDGTHTGQKVRSFKPVFLADAGINWQFTDRLSARAWSMYSVKKLSGVTFSALDLCMGISYSFGEQPASGNTIADEKTLLAEGFIYMNRKNLRAAEKAFREVLKFYHDSSEAKAQLEKIKQITERFNDAVRLEKSGDQFAALSMLDGIKDSYDEAELKYSSLKTELLAMKDKMRKEGIDAYNSGDYEKSFDILSKLVKISPEDREIDAYLQRAKRKLEALNKLR